MEEEFADAIAIVSDQLGIAAEHIYDVFVTAQPMVGMVNIGMGIGVLLLSVLVGVVAHKELKNLFVDSDNNYDADADNKFWIMVATVFAVLITIMIGSMVANIISGQVLKIMCPEYTALREIFGLAMG